MVSPSNAALYGIENSNRNFREPIYWGKNQFNSSFPVALCCYMRDKGKTALEISLKKDLSCTIGEISFDDVFGTHLPNDKLFFRFEADFPPFKSLVADSLEKIDVVIVDNENKKEIRPLEIKLTTLPDDGTSDFSEDKYGSEIVVRSPTMRYVALSMAASCKNDLATVKKIFGPVCRKIDNWENVTEMRANRKNIFKALKKFLADFCHQQYPLLIQPIWKTRGKAPELAENCLDVFVWTNYAIVGLILDSLEDEETSGISRPQRAALRLSRFLYEISREDEVYQKPIYDGMTYGTLNDKEFSVSGRKTNLFMASDRLKCPCVTKNEIKKIVLGGGQKFLSPERRFDSILFFSKELFDE